MIWNFNSPWAFISFSELNTAKGCPARGLKCQPFCGAEFISVKPFVVDKRFIRYWVKWCKTRDFSDFNWKNNSPVLGSNVLYFLTHCRVIQGQLFCNRSGKGNLIVLGESLWSKEKIATKQSKNEYIKFIFYAHVFKGNKPKLEKIFILFILFGRDLIM